MVLFKKIAVKIEGFKYPTVYIKELSVKQVREMSKQNFDNDIDSFLFGLSHCLINEQGDKVINADYTSEQLAEELPQSYMNKLADAFSKINSDDEETALELAKNS